MKYYNVLHCHTKFINIRSFSIIRGFAVYRKEMFYLMTHSTHFIYSYMASDIWWRTIQIAREETRCHHIGYSFRLAARVLLYAPSHRQDSTYHSLCYTSHGALAGTRNSSMGPLYEGSIWRPIAPWAKALTTELHLAPCSLQIYKPSRWCHRWWRSTQFSHAITDYVPWCLIASLGCQILTKSSIASHRFVSIYSLW